MNILLCPDKFKGSLTAREVCAALHRGLAPRYPDAEIVSRPLADGGDGSLDVLEDYLDVRTVTIECSDPLGRPIQASYRRSGSAAYIEVAAASGLVLLREAEREVLKTSSLGTGQLMAHAVEHGVQEVFLFLGGSATNDAGMGIAHALGYRFLDDSGQALPPIGKHLGKVASIDQSGLIPEMANVKVHVVCDVDNPLFGPNGAAYVYAPQKGATESDVELLDEGLRNLAKKLVAAGYPDVGELPGAGAAGGIGGGAVAFLNGHLQSGTATFLEISQLEKQVKEADLIITGEGFLDAQTAQGKLISGVCDLAHQHGKPIIGVCGGAEDGIAESLGLKQLYTIMDRSDSLAEAMNKAAEKLEEIGEKIE